MLILYLNPCVISSQVLFYILIVFIGLYSILFAPKTTAEIFRISGVKSPPPIIPKPHKIFSYTQRDNILIKWKIRVYKSI